MQDRFSRIIIFLIIVLSIFHSGEALKCYNCLGTSNCEKGPFDEMECPVDETVCIKLTVVLQTSVVNITSFGRTCGGPGFCEIAKYIGATTCDECSTNLCNASTNNTVS